MRLLLFASAVLMSLSFGQAQTLTSSPSPAAAVSAPSPHKHHTRKSAATTLSPAASPGATAIAPTKPVRTEQPANMMPAGNGQVWVNTDTHVYHKSGSRFYGKTKQGKYLSEQEAIKEGDKPAKNEKQP